jgi:serine phosphatase RsbU (regulator of sigma subunit)/PAS domain-containing protein
MQQDGGIPDLERELDGIRSRRDALRHSAALPGAQAQQLMSRAFAELDAAIEVGEKLQSGSAGNPSAEAADAERRLLREMFQHAPVPMFLLEHAGGIRRANRRAGQLLGTQPGSATGRLLTAFVDPPARATAAAQVAAATRTGRQQHLRCRMLGPDGPFDAILTIAPLRAGGQQLLLVALGRDMLRDQAAAGPAAGGAQAGGGRRGPTARASVTAAVLSTAPSEAALTEVVPGEPDPGEVPDEVAVLPGAQVPSGAPAPAAVIAAADTGEAVLDSEAARVVAAMSQRVDLVSAATRLLLDNATFSEAATLRRCARLLAGELAAWVIVDVERRQRLRRQVVIGPRDRESATLARRIGAVHPRKSALQRQVHDSGSAALVSCAQDPTILGAGRDNIPLLTLLEATSLLCVPLSDGERNYGVLTLVRRSGEQPFEVGDLALVEELGQQLGLAIRVDRMFRRRSEIADSLQASLLPAALPELPGVELAAAYVAATDAEGIEVGGDFYDVYPSPAGWGLAIGDVCGKGEEAAAVTAAARHAIRVLAHWNADPADVLRRANEVLQTTEFDGRFVTACAGFLQWDQDTLQVRMATAGHPGQIIIRADGRVEPLAGGGIALGLFPAAEMDAEDIELDDGDMLFMFTDGVTEARSPDMEYFEDRLPGELARLAGRSAAEVVSAMQALVLEFSQNELRDDVTMLVLRVGTQPGRLLPDDCGGRHRAGLRGCRQRSGDRGPRGQAG